ncbi:MAG: IMP cyclohydrolase [Eubacterium sp.]|nr:IMP cyclohydrolase [Oscillospiraceae bacterium]MDD6354925.1 IMP cyclohydrolase [Oscillospiraceae bacterium]MDY4608147.1 IMP cyclohydrolase [Eubacterium sp.]
MEIKSLASELNTNSYPGRGIVVGKSADGKKAVIAYFIMGRSVNSRNRIFEPNDRGGIRTKAFDESKMEDPSLIIYNPVLKLDGKTIVTNGDQTDTIYDFMQEGKCYRHALNTREFEPDAPNYTPRISAVLKPNGDYNMSILKSNMGKPQCLRFYFEYPADAGLGHFIHTYKCDGNPIPSYEGEPTPVAVGNDDIDTWTDMIWDNLNEDNKVSLFTRYIDLQTGEEETRIVNKNK